MQEQILILPLQYNEGHSTANLMAEYESRLVETFGGYSAETVQGAYRADNGTICRESVLRFTLATDDGAAVLALAAAAADDFRQESIYARVNGAVQFVTGNNVNAVTEFVAAVA